jgi:hypothetical protein
VKLTLTEEDQQAIDAAVAVIDYRIGDVLSPLRSWFSDMDMEAIRKAVCDSVRCRATLYLGLSATAALVVDAGGGSPEHAKAFVHSAMDFEGDFNRVLEQRIFGSPIALKLEATEDETQRREELRREIWKSFGVGDGDGLSKLNTDQLERLIAAERRAIASEGLQDKGDTLHDLLWDLENAALDTIEGRDVPRTHRGPISGGSPISGATP